MTFTWPWQYSFPPFFTLQPNLETRRRQLSSWRELVLSFYKENKKTTLDVNEATSIIPFSNPEINRKLSPEGLQAVLEELQKTGNLEWTDKSKTRCYIYWRGPAEWGKLVYKWAQDNGMTNSVCTVPELLQGEDTIKQDFHGMDQAVFLKALRSLEKDGKAEIMETGDGFGVKFF